MHMEREYDFEYHDSQFRRSLADLMVWDSRAKLITCAYRTPCSNYDDEIVLFVNAGSMTPPEGNEPDRFMADSFFEGGYTIQTKDFIDGGNCYQSARLGNFSYRFDNLVKGEYFVDLYFSEIIFNAEGMRVFNVFMQDEKILANLDIFLIVGFKKALQVIEARAVVKDDGVLFLRFEGVVGSPVVSGISVRNSPERLDEIYKEWASLRAAYKQLKKVRMDLETFQTYSLEKQAENRQKSWTEAINNLEQKVKIMKRDHAELSREAHECADSIPDLNQMVSAVQSLVEQCEDLKFKYNEEQAKVANLSEKLKVKEESSNKLQQKVYNDLENKLRDQKIKELKRQLKEIEEHLSLHQKIKELEEQLSESTNLSKSTPMENK